MKLCKDCGADISLRGIAAKRCVTCASTLVRSGKVRDRRDATKRDLEVIRLAEVEGMTCEMIGLLPTIQLSKARVHRILSNYGVVPKSTRYLIDREMSPEARALWIEQRGQRVAHGLDCLMRDAIRLNEGQPLSTGQAAAYRAHKLEARKRGAPWQFTFPAWLALWKESGHLHERGARGGYVMTRRDTNGPFSPDNCFVGRQGDVMRKHRVHQTSDKKKALEDAMHQLKTVLLETLTDTGAPLSKIVEAFGQACDDAGVPAVLWKGQERSVVQRLLRELEGQKLANRQGVDSRGTAMSDPLWGNVLYEPKQYALATPRPVGRPRVAESDPTLAVLEERVRLASEELREARKALADYKTGQVAA